MKPKHSASQVSPESHRGAAHAPALAIVCCCAMLFSMNADGGAAEPVAAGQTNSTLGIGFLWTAQGEPVVDRLDSERDFVDLILGPGRMDVFEKVKSPRRVACIALSLERHPARPFPGIKETIEMLRRAGIPPGRVLIAYNPERAPGTTTAEMDDLPGSARRAGQMARAYGAPLIIGPGLKEMSRREHLYPELAKCCDIWLIQSQRLQLDAVTRKPVAVAEYREKVKQIVDRLRQGNPKIQVFLQVMTTAERGKTVLSAEQIAGFARAVEDLVDAVRIYGARADQLDKIIKQLRPVPPVVPRGTEEKGVAAPRAAGAASDAPLGGR